MERKFILIAILLGSFFCSISAFSPCRAEESDEDLLNSMVNPNVLVIIDNSSSMDEDFFGAGIGPFASGSKSVEGKKAMTDLINDYAANMRLGLMTYRLSGGVSPWFIHNAAYFVSYEPKSYCPNPAQACVDYCRDPGNTVARAACESSCKGPEPARNPVFDVDYIDDGVAPFPLGSIRDSYCNLVYPKTGRMINWTDPTNYIYYKYALPAYTSAAPLADHFEVACSYSADNSSGEYYNFYNTKTGTSDAVPATCGAPDAASGYDIPSGGQSWAPSDSDKALGFFEFGRREALRYTGKAWHINTSPGGGYLDVPVKDIDGPQKTALLTKLQPFENDEAGYMTCTPPSGDYNQCPHVVNAGLTPTAGTLKTAAEYFKGVHSGPTGPVLSPVKADSLLCQKNYIIYVTDGLPSVNETGGEDTAANLMPAVIARIMELRNLSGTTADATPFTGLEVKTYVVGVGLTSDAKAYLDQMAVAGGTDVDGHAYYADNPDQLKAALEGIFHDIGAGKYSFSLPSISSYRDENSLYISSFETMDSEPLWTGHLRKVNVNDNGSLGTVAWDAGVQLEGTGGAGRNIHTVVGTLAGPALVPFDNSLNPSLFGLSTDLERNFVVDYIRGIDPLTNPNTASPVPHPDKPRKLGDIYHSNPITIGTPSLFFNDSRDRSHAFEAFRAGHIRKSDDSTRLIIAGANDGQLHAFETGTGMERWSFIPPNLLKKLSGIVHYSHPARDAFSSHPHRIYHDYFVDGPVSAAEVWLPAMNSEGRAKNSADWKTLLVFGLGIGVRDGENPDYLWSKWESCDRDFKRKYNPPYKYYCGYYALDVTNTAIAPQFKWTLKPRGGFDGDYLAEPWSKMAIGRVKKDGNEVWVGFMGGGYNNTTDADAGKGFFVVDLKDGAILWSYTKANHGSLAAIPARPAIMDSDGDGFIDTAYVGDRSGNLWKFTFCGHEDGAGCGTAQWTLRARRLFNPSENRPIYTTPAVAKDLKGQYWIFWGTGNKAYPHRLPSLTPRPNAFYGLIDSNVGSALPPSPYTTGNLQDITGSLYTESDKQGWYIKFDDTGRERVLADAAVYNGVVFFTTYTAPAAGGECGRVGMATLYGVAMMPVSLGGDIYNPGKGVFSPADPIVGRKVSLGPGIASAPVFSQKPYGGTGGETDTDAYISISGGAISGTEIKTDDQIPELAKVLANTGTSTGILHWRDLRVQP